MITDHGSQNKFRVGIHAGISENSAQTIILALLAWDLWHKDSIDTYPTFQEDFFFFKPNFDFPDQTKDQKVLISFLKLVYWNHKGYYWRIFIFQQSCRNRKPTSSFLAHSLLYSKTIVYPLDTLCSLMVITHLICLVSK